MKATDSSEKAPAKKAEEESNPTGGSVLKLVRSAPFLPGLVIGLALIGIVLLTLQTANLSTRADSLRVDVAAQIDANAQATAEQERLAAEAAAHEAWLVGEVNDTCATITTVIPEDPFSFESTVEDEVLERMREQCPTGYWFVTNYVDIDSGILNSLSDAGCEQWGWNSSARIFGHVTNPADRSIDINITAVFFQGDALVDTGFALLEGVGPGQTVEYSAAGANTGYDFTACAFALVNFWPTTTN